MIHIVVHKGMRVHIAQIIDRNEQGRRHLPLNAEVHCNRTRNFEVRSESTEKSVQIKDIRIVETGCSVWIKVPGRRCVSRLIGLLHGNYGVYIFSYGLVDEGCNVNGSPRYGAAGERSNIRQPSRNS